MTRIDWKRKLASRKFWAAVIACVGAVCGAFGLSSGSIEQVASIIGAFAALIVYILAEGRIDEARESTRANGMTDLINSVGVLYVEKLHGDEEEEEE